MLIFLIGMMGSGKTSVAKALATKLDVSHYDTDQLLVDKLGMSIIDYFDRYGEKAFREQEAELLKNWNIQSGVISTGGGMPCFNDNIQLLNQLGTTIYIECSIPTLVKRLTQDQNGRPLIKNLSQNELTLTLKSVLEKRKDFYIQAHHTVQNEDNVRNVTTVLFSLVPKD